MFIKKDQREIQCKLRILRYAEDIGHVAKTCRYFGIGRTSFYRWRNEYSEREEKVLYLCRKYHLGPMRIVWYLVRYNNIISGNRVLIIWNKIQFDANAMRP